MESELIPVLNLTNLLQVHGHTEMPPGMWTPVDQLLAIRLAESEDYRVDDDAMKLYFPYRDGTFTHLGWCSPLHYADGYGSVAQEIAAEFIRMGVGLSIRTRDYDPSHKRFGALDLDKWEDEAFVPPEIVQQLKYPQGRVLYGIHMTWPRDIHRHKFPRGIGYTMFETTKPPEAWAEAMNKCRRLMVPCEQNKTAFEGIGVTTPIHVVPLGVNPKAWPYIDRSRKKSFPFTFLMAAGITHRKNPHDAVKAFIAAFPDRQDVRLILKTRGKQCSPGFWDWEKELPKDPRVTVIKEESTPAQMLKYMHEADAFVFPSHSEGFGLTPLQAMCTGLPTIVSDNSGMSEYAYHDVCWPIPCDEVPVPDCRHGGFPEAWGNVGNWWQPSMVALVSAYRGVYFHKKLRTEKGNLAAEYVRDKWTIRRTCERILGIVEEDFLGSEK